MPFTSKMHHFLNTKILRKVLVACQICGTTYYINNNDYDKRKQYYCSPHCALNGIANYQLQ